MECGLSFPSAHSFTFVFFSLPFSVFVLLSPCSLLLAPCSLLLPLSFAGSFSYLFHFSSLSLSIFVLLCSFSILSRELSASSLSLPSLCAASQPVLTVFKVFIFFLRCLLFFGGGGGGGPAEMRKIQWFCPTSGITSEVLAC